MVSVLLYQYRKYYCSRKKKIVIVKTLATNGLVIDTALIATSIQTKYCQ